MSTAAVREVVPVLVCHCHRVNDDRIERVLSAGADGVRGVVRATRAGTGCGGCLPALRELCADRSVPPVCGLHAKERRADEVLAG